MDIVYCTGSKSSRRDICHSIRFGELSRTVLLPISGNDSEPSYSSRKTEKP